VDAIDSGHRCIRSTGKAGASVVEDDTPGWDEAQSSSPVPNLGLLFAEERASPATEAASVVKQWLAHRSS
jgi:hypothetical protein